MTLLSVQNLNTGYGKKQVLFNVSLDIEEGETVMLIGANGSGKSTLFKSIFQLLPEWNFNANATSIKFRSTELLNKDPHQLIKMGLVYIPQTEELFFGMTVHENLELSLFHLNNKLQVKNRIQSVYSYLPELNRKKNQLISNLSGGEKKFLNVGMALANRPNLLLFDEPISGISPNKVPQVIDSINFLKSVGSTILIIEHRIKDIIAISNRIFGMRSGVLSELKNKSLESVKDFLVNN